MLFCPVWFRKSSIAMVQKHVYSCSTQHIHFQHSKGAEEEIKRWALTSEAQQQHGVVSSTIRTSLFRHFKHKTIKLFLIYCNLFGLINFLYTIIATSIQCTSSKFHLGTQTIPVYASISPLVKVQLAGYSIPACTTTNSVVPQYPPVLLELLFLKFRPLLTLFQVNLTDARAHGCMFLNCLN